jgi:hypothetical protein
MLPQVTFTDSVTPLILEAFNISVGDDNYLYRGNDKVLDAVDNKPLTLEEFCGIHNNEVYKGDLHSIINIVEK